jgi:phosphoribosylaminoimidazolecarboxamide formyltransferase / IMP cyclohydrolase
MKALLSVYDKTGIVEFAKALQELNVEILSTGGTAKLLKENKIKVTGVSDYTGFPEIMNGRVKTLHPKIHGGILAVRDNKEHIEKAKEHNIDLIDIVVVNLYPFEETVSKDCTFEEALEQIDIGGPTMLRSAAKNFEDVVVVSNPEKYNEVIEALKKKDVPRELRLSLAKEVFNHTAHYDTVISTYIEGKGKKRFPKHLEIAFEKVQDMRYGENPHQFASFYREAIMNEPCVSNAKQLHGKQLSYNNIIDINDALELVKDFDEPTAAIIKHTNPCGVASAETIEKAYKLAHAADPMSAFGCIVALNRDCTMGVAEIVSKLFIEVVICPKFDKDALELLMKKKNVRLLETGELHQTKKGYDMRKVVGGILVQTRNTAKLDPKELKVVTKKNPTDKELNDMLFAWKVNKHVKSNSIVFAKDQVAVGVGAGQMSRVDSSIIAARKAGDNAKGAVMSSDAFFPFRDGVDEAVKAGVTAIIQPGGSIRDQEVIDAANEHGIAMVFSGVRLFKH